MKKTFTVTFDVEVEVPDVQGYGTYVAQVRSCEPDLASIIHNDVSLIQVAGCKFGFPRDLQINIKKD